MYRILLAAGLMCLSAKPFAATAHQPHADILAAARAHVEQHAEQFGGNIEVTAKPLDRRLRLGLCELPLQTYESPNGLRPGRSVVGVRCDGAKPWKIFVSVNIATVQPVVVLAQPLARGQTVTAEHILLSEQDTSRLHRGYFSDPAQVIGQRSKRNLAVGKVVTPSTLARRQLVKRGSDVQILAKLGGLQVRMKGKALSNGAMGERIKVRNHSSGRVITGTVIDSGMILVQQ